MNLEQEFTEKQKTAFSHAIFEYLYDNNEKRSIDNGGQITFENRFVKVFKNADLLSSFVSNITIHSDVPSQRFIVYIDNSEEIRPLVGKETFWPTKYIIKYEHGFLIIEDNEIRIIMYPSNLTS